MWKSNAWTALASVFSFSVYSRQLSYSGILTTATRQSNLTCLKQFMVRIFVFSLPHWRVTQTYRPRIATNTEGLNVWVCAAHTPTNLFKFNAFQVDWTVWPRNLLLTSWALLQFSHQFLTVPPNSVGETMLCVSPATPVMTNFRKSAMFTNLCLIRKKRKRFLFHFLSCSTTICSSSFLYSIILCRRGITNHYLAPERTNEPGNPLGNYLCDRTSQPLSKKHSRCVLWKDFLVDGNVTSD